MPQHIITETVADYIKHKEVEERKDAQNSCLAILFALSAFIGLCYWLQP